MDVANKLVHFKTNGVLRCEYGVMTIQLMEKHAPYLNGVHFMAHNRKLII